MALSTGLGAFFGGAARGDAGLVHHLGVEEGTRVQRDVGAPGIASRAFERVADERELRVAVGEHAVVVALAHQVRG